MPQKSGAGYTPKASENVPLWHTLDVSEVLSRLNTNTEDGLSAGDAANRRQEKRALTGKVV